MGQSLQVETIRVRERGAGARARRWPHWQSATVLVLGLLITTALTVSSALSYVHTERRLTTLQTRLTASVLQTAQPQLQATLGRVVGLTAATTDPAATFRQAMAGELAPRGQFASATVAVVDAGRVRVLDHVGAPAIQSLNSPATTQLFLKSARTSALVTNRVVAGGVQKLVYLLSARGRAGVYVVGASQQLPVGNRVTVKAGSPDANLNFALYFGPAPIPQALIETNAERLPLTGTVARASVPFGNNVLTLVASPRGSLAGAWAQYLPWGILGLGILLSIAAAVVTENLIRRRATAETLYTQQRRVSETLQRSLLPKRMPEIPRWEFAALYVPATKGAEIGGDWYSVVEVDEDHFALVVGDVSGHDIAAAGVMAALRYTIRTLAKLGVPPDEMLDRTAKELYVTSDDHLATVLVGIVDTRMQELTLASAGHPPPLLVRNGHAEFVKVTPGVPLGVPGRRPKPVTTHFAPGSTLVAFTDGLIERRDQTLDVGLARLATTAARSSTQPDDLIARLIETLTPEEQEDDIAVLAIRFTADDADLEAGDSMEPDPLSIGSDPVRSPIVPER